VGELLLARTERVRDSVRKAEENAMGTLRGDNGGGQPPNGGGLPDLPPEWGTIIIPDDPSELSREITQVRRELRRVVRRDRWRRRLHLPPVTGPRTRDGSSIGLPLLIMAIAIVATLTSLFALAWPGSSGHLGASPPLRASTAAVAVTTVPDLTLRAADGSQLHLRNSLPAVLLLADGCACADLEQATAQAAPAGVTVLAIARTAPTLPSAAPIGLRIRSAADPDGQLRSAYAGSPPSAGVIAVLVKGTGEVIKTVLGVVKVDDFATDLAKLA
jgi:hypothetical protein